MHCAEPPRPPQVSQPVGFVSASTAAGVAAAGAEEAEVCPAVPRMRC